MRSYFRGWKRKIGAGTLLIACMLIAACIRSYRATDTLDSICGRFESHDGLIWMSFEEMPGRALAYQPIIIFLSLLSVYLLAGRQSPGSEA